MYALISLPPLREARLIVCFSVPKDLGGLSLPLQRCRLCSAFVATRGVCAHFSLVQYMYNR